MLLSLHASPPAGLTRNARAVPARALGSAVDARLHALRASLPAASTLVLVLGFVMAAGLGAAVIATGNLVASGLILGALLGVLMLDAPALAVWIVLVGTLAVTGPLVMHQPQFARLAWLFSVLGMFLMAAALLHAATARRARHARAGLPGFVVLAAAVLIYALIGIPFSDGPPEEWMSGIKRQFQYWGLFFAFALVPFTQAQVNRWLRFLLVLGLPAYRPRASAHEHAQRSGAGGYRGRHLRRLDHRWRQ